MAEDALTFGDLRIKVAVALGVAYYGAAGTSNAAAPDDAPTLDMVDSYINGGIRMLLNDAPPGGWRFQQPTASVVLWSSIAVAAAVTVTGSGFVTSTTITATGGTPFYPSMVGHTITFTSGGDFVIDGYTSSTVISVAGDASAVSGETFAMTANGRYTLPSTFGGEYSGPITYAAGTDSGTPIEWISEGIVRSHLESGNSTTGYPSIASVRKMDATDVARRWELLVYPIAGGDYTVEFPYELYFTALSAATDVHPAGPHFDEAVLAACEGYAELKGEDNLAGRMEYYRKSVLPGMHRRNTRAAPRKLGSLKQRLPQHPEDWRDYVQRPTVTTP